MDQKPPFDDGQLAKAIYLRNMAAMKEVLKLGEFRMGGRESTDYKYFKKIVMDQFYNSMTDIFAALEKKGLLQKCPCGTTIRLGYKSCPNCNGAGHCNVEEFTAWVMDYEPDETPPEEPEDPPQPQ